MLSLSEGTTRIRMTVHSAVERASQNVEIYTSSEWAAVPKEAKHKKPHYKVSELDITDFHDFKTLLPFWSS